MSNARKEEKNWNDQVKEAKIKATNLLKQTPPIDEGYRIMLTNQLNVLNMLPDFPNNNPTSKELNKLKTFETIYEKIKGNINAKKSMAVQRYHHGLFDHENQLMEKLKAKPAVPPKFRKKFG